MKVSYRVFLKISGIDIIYNNDINIISRFLLLYTIHNIEYYKFSISVSLRHLLLCYINGHNTQLTAMKTSPHNNVIQSHFVKYCHECLLAVESSRWCISSSSLAWLLIRRILAWSHVIHSMMESLPENLHQGWKGKYGLKWKVSKLWIFMIWFHTLQSSIT